MWKKNQKVLVDLTGVPDYEGFKGCFIEAIVCSHDATTDEYLVNLYLDNTRRKLTVEAKRIFHMLRFSKLPTKFRPNDHVAVNLSSPFTGYWRGRVTATDPRYTRVKWDHPYPEDDPIAQVSTKDVAKIRY
jgi:hypothetical protein